MKPYTERQTLLSIVFLELFVASFSFFLFWYLPHPSDFLLSIPIDVPGEIPWRYVVLYLCWVISSFRKLLTCVTD